MAKRVIEILSAKIFASSCTKGDFGFNAKTGEYVNMIEAGIIDPAKVTRTAVINAASISSLFVTTESIVTEMPKPQTPAPIMPSPDMDY